MAESGNGQLEVGFGDKRIAVTSRDLISVLLIAVAGLGGYFIANQLTTNQSRAIELLGKNQAALVDLLHINRQQIGAEMKAIVEAVAILKATLTELVHSNRQQMEAGLKVQDALLQQQTTLLIAKVDEQSKDRDHKFEQHDKDIETKFAQVYRALNILNHNLHLGIEEQLPLNGAPPTLPQR
jgi:hypothetical protein